MYNKNKTEIKGTDCDFYVTKNKQDYLQRNVRSFNIMVIITVYTVKCRV